MPSMNRSSLRAPTAYLREKGLVGYRSRPDCKLEWQSIVKYCLIEWCSELALKAHSSYIYLKTILCKGYVEASLGCLVVQVMVLQGPLPG